jgi:hypothetical protein
MTLFDRDLSEALTKAFPLPTGGDSSAELAAALRALQAQIDREDTGQSVSCSAPNAPPNRAAIDPR